MFKKKSNELTQVERAFEDLCILRRCTQRIHRFSPRVSLIHIHRATGMAKIDKLAIFILNSNITTSMFQEGSEIKREIYNMLNDPNTLKLLFQRIDNITGYLSNYGINLADRLVNIPFETTLENILEQYYSNANRLIIEKLNRLYYLNINLFEIEENQPIPLDFIIGKFMYRQISIIINTIFIDFVKFGYSELIDRLLKVEYIANEISRQVIYPTWESRFNFAIAKSNAETVDILINYRLVSVHAILLVSIVGNIEVGQLLLDHGLYDDLNIPLYMASEAGHLEFVQLLLERGADVTARDNQALIAAIGNGYLEVVNLLLEKGADVTALDNEALIRASENGYLEVVHLLLERGADVTARDNLALIKASRNGHLEVINLLREYGAQLNEDENVSEDEETSEYDSEETSEYDSEETSDYDSEETSDYDSEN